MPPTSPSVWPSWGAAWTPSSMPLSEWSFDTTFWSSWRSWVAWARRGSTGIPVAGGGAQRPLILTPPPHSLPKTIPGRTEYLFTPTDHTMDCWKWGLKKDSNRNIFHMYISEVVIHGMIVIYDFIVFLLFLSHCQCQLLRLRKALPIFLLLGNISIFLVIQEMCCVTQSHVQ